MVDAPEECTFTALAGAPVAEIDGVSRPTDNTSVRIFPLAAAGDDDAGRPGVNGSCRYRYRRDPQTSF